VTHSKQKSKASSNGVRPKNQRSPAAYSPHKSICGFTGFIKRCFDIGVSAVALILLAPLFLAIAFLVWLEDRGPVFYSQIRVGLGGHRFRLFKYRTMLEDAEQDLGAVWSVPKDPRCTRIGLILRAASTMEHFTR